MARISALVPGTVAVVLAAGVIQHAESPAPARAAAAVSAPVVAARPAAARPAYPATFVGARGNRLAVFSSKNGAFLRNLTPAVAGGDAGLPAVSANRKRVYFVRTTPAAPCPSTYSVPLGGGKVTLVRSGQQGGAQPIAVGSKGAFAGTYSCLASQFVRATVPGGKSYNISGVRNLGADGLAWAPSGLRLAVSTESAGVRTFDPRRVKSFQGAPTVPCPAGLKGCVTHAPAYASSGALYYVAAKGRTAKVVRFASGKAKVVFTLPRVSAHYSLAVAPGGHVLASGDADSGAMTRSDFVVRWDGKRRHTLGRSMFQVDW